MDRIKVGDNVFFRHPEHSWVRGIVKRIGKEEIDCLVDDHLRSEVPQSETVTLRKLDELEQLDANSINEAANDLLTLTTLHEAMLLRSLYMRYTSDVIYTNMGNRILLALNPLDSLISRCQSTDMQKYLTAGLNSNGLGMPHFWTHTHVAYLDMMNNHANQCIIVSGVSGAGKSVTVEKVLKYLIGVSSLTAVGEAEQKVAQGVGKKLLASLPVLECFGHAKTLQNDNSSRFGRFTKVKFNPNGGISGAETEKYLFESSRVVSAAQGERLFHSFYLLTRAHGSMARALGLENEKHYLPLFAGGATECTKYNTEKDFDVVCRAMRNLGITDDEIVSVWRIVAAIMSLRNVSFFPEKQGCCIESSTMKYFKKAVELLEIDGAALAYEFLTTAFVLLGNKTVLKKNSVVAATDIRDTMCRHLYDGMLTWLVERCNCSCSVEEDGNWIGVLDTFSFEDLKVNSFEQFCINLLNEHLYKHYNSQVSKYDMEEYRNEGLDVADICVADNTSCVKMLSSQNGILSILDECCWVRGGTDLDFLDKVVSVHKSNPFFKIPHASEESFCIRHYATDVTYDVLGWIKKNRNSLKESIKALVLGSGNSTIAVCLQALKSSSEERSFTVGGVFRNRLVALMNLISSTDPHWIHCIKPHQDKRLKMFHGGYVMRQLEFSGALCALRSRNTGYPVRIPRDMFCAEYRMCSPLTTTDDKTFIQDVLSRAQLHIPAMAQLGKSKVFMKAEAFNVLQCIKNQHKLQQTLQVSFGKVYPTEEEEKKRERKLAEQKENEGSAQGARRLEALRNRAAICIQRYVRGELVRARLYRQLLEERRAATEYEYELLCEKERAEVRQLDAQRVMDENLWIEWLNTMDLLRYQRQRGENWSLARLLQKTRLLIRELLRKEEQERVKLGVVESDERCVLLCRHRDLTTHLIRLEAERQKETERLEGNNARRLLLQQPRCQQPAGIRARALRSATSDARMQKTLMEYALSRARLHDKARESGQSVSLADRMANRSFRENFIFSMVQQNWSQQQEWVGGEGLALAKELSSKLSLMTDTDESHLTGPYQTIEGSLHSISPLLHLSPQPTLFTAGGKRSGSMGEDSLWTLNEIEIKEKKKKKNTFDWDTVFTS